jgi:DNA-directed RNA polymerase subunit K/omega
MPPKKSKKKDEEEYTPEIEVEEEAIEETEDYDDEPPLDEDESEEEESDEEEEVKVTKQVEEETEYFEDDDEVLEIQPDTSVTYVIKEERISANRLSKYEMVRILGERTKQLTMGAKPLIKNFQDLSYDRIAQEELKVNMIPYKIRRPLPNGKYELWTLDELNKEHLLSLLDD